MDGSDAQHWGGVGGGLLGAASMLVHAWQKLTDDRSEKEMLLTLGRIEAEVKVLSSQVADLRAERSERRRR